MKRNQPYPPNRRTTDPRTVPWTLRRTAIASTASWVAHSAAMTARSNYITVYLAPGGPALDHRKINEFDILIKEELIGPQYARTGQPWLS